MTEADEPRAIPLVEETLHIAKRTVTTGRVRVRTEVEERIALAAADLTRETADIERVAIDREITEAPDVRREGDTLIIPVVEEMLVVTKRLVLREELRVTLHRTTEHVTQPVALRSTHAVVEREDAPDTQEPAPQP
jgi:uncharacterized protein (TIGR02271 family)